MNSDNPLVDGVRSWFERTPKAQRAYRRLSADLDTLVERIDAATTDLRERIGPILDPPASTATMDRPETAPESAAQTSDSVVPESESSVPPGVKREGEPIDPTT